MPRFYFDYRRYRESQAKGETPWTPAVSLYFQLDVALGMMEREGRQAIFDRHARIGAHTRAGVKALGLQLFANEAYASNTVTAVRAPEGVDASVITKRLREEHGVVVAGGQTKLKGKIFRIGHLGYVTEPDIDGALAALSKVLADVGVAAVR
jgi:aspartate aminotransferase-like enzyme